MFGIFTNVTGLLQYKNNLKTYVRLSLWFEYNLFHVIVQNDLGDGYGLIDAIFFRLSHQIESGSSTSHFVQFYFDIFSVFDVLFR